MFNVTRKFCSVYLVLKKGIIVLNLNVKLQVVNNEFLANVLIVFYFDFNKSLEVLSNIFKTLKANFLYIQNTLICLLINRLLTSLKQSSSFINTIRYF